MRNLEIWMRCECYDAGRERQRNVLAAVLSFINVRVEVYIGNIPVQNRTGGVDHAIGDLGTDSYSVASHNTQQSMESEKKKSQDVRDASDTFDAPRFDKIKRFHLLHDWTDELDMTASER